MKEPKQKKSIKKIITDVVFYIFMAFFAGVITLSIVQRTTGIQISNRSVVRVLSGSMEPTFKQNDYILTEKFDGSDAKVGDVVTFVVHDPTSPIDGKNNTHRIIRENPDGSLVTKGDHNLVEDKPIQRSDIVGKYIKKLPVLSFLFGIFTTLPGYICTVVLIVGLVVLWYILNARENSKKKKEQLINEKISEEVKRLVEESKQIKE